MKKPQAWLFPLLGVATLFLATLACSTTASVQDAQSTLDATKVWLPTIESYIKTITALSPDFTPGPSPTTTSTSKCDWIGPLGECFTLPEVEPIWPGATATSLGAELTPQPTFSGTIIIDPDSDGNWISYYNKAGEKLGIVRRGSTWPGEGNQLQLTGWTVDLELECQGDNCLTRCQLHSWFHLDGDEQCHAHIIDISPRDPSDEVPFVLATLEEGMYCWVSGPSSIQLTRNEDGLLINARGRVITCEEVRISP